MRKIILVMIVVCTPQLASAKNVKYRKTQEVNFEETNVEGTARTPDGAYVTQRKGIKFLPMYDVKKNFRKKIKDSVDHLR